MSTMMKGFGKDAKEKWKGLKEKMSHVEISSMAMGTGMGMSMGSGLANKALLRRHDSAEERWRIMMHLKG